MAFHNRFAFPLQIVLLLSSVPLAQAVDHDPRKAIQAVLDKQVAAWNKGDMEGFMAGYWRSQQLVYMGGKKPVRGYDALLELYRKIADPGTLALLPDEEITLISPDSAVVWGTYTVTGSDGKVRGGPYTLVMHKMKEGWLTVYDRTSSEPLQK